MHGETKTRKEGKMKELDLTEMKNSISGTIVKILGGRGMRTRVGALGIRVGCKIEKVSEHMMRGPVVVKVGATRAAIGYGMAKKIIVSVE